nr:NUDIX domain-containing protein [Nocardiopsis halotolerans]
MTHSVEERSTGRRIDYYDDPEAPAANSLVPSVNVFVVNECNEVLMIRRTDNDNWAVPGGTLDLGESVPQSAVRETLEETGVTCEITGIVGIYSDPKHIIYYTNDGEARQEFSIAFTARPMSGEPTPSDESKEVVWVPKDKLTEYRMDRSMRVRVDHFLSGGPTHIG